MMFKRFKKAQVVVPAPDSVAFLIPVQVMNAIFDRRPGRWCSACAQHGSHHTESHNSFAAAALELAIEKGIYER